MCSWSLHVTAKLQTHVTSLSSTHNVCPDGETPHEHLGITLSTRLLEGWVFFLLSLFYVSSFLPAQYTLGLQPRLATHLCFILVHFKLLAYIFTACLCGHVDFIIFKLRFLFG